MLGMNVHESSRNIAGPSICFLVSLNSFAFSYSLVVATLGVVILPSEAIRLFSDRHAMMLGIMLGATGVTQLLGPAVGYQSDRSTSRYGRRRPLLVVGAVVACVGCVTMRITRELYWCNAYIGALTASIAGLNIRHVPPLLVARPLLAFRTAALSCLSARHRKAKQHVNARCDPVCPCPRVTPHPHHGGAVTLATLH